MLNLNGYKVNKNNDYFRHFPFFLFPFRKIVLIFYLGASRFEIQVLMAGYDMTVAHFTDKLKNPNKFGFSHALYYLCR